MCIVYVDKASIHEYKRENNCEKKFVNVSGDVMSETGERVSTEPVSGCLVGLANTPSLSTTVSESLVVTRSVPGVELSTVTFSSFTSDVIRVYTEAFPFVMLVIREYADEDNCIGRKSYIVNI